ncbi:MAG: hypothetical protein ACOY3Y_01975 [Acidobacteriota bacterium]
MESFAAPVDLVESARYEHDRKAALTGFDLDGIDAPIRDLARLPHCFTMQCCWGHFVCRPGPRSHALEPVPEDHVGPVRHRIAYLALCVENSAPGRRLLGALRQLTETDTSLVHFGSPGWFAKSGPSTYAAQVEPVLSRLEDEAVLTRDEALLVKCLRDRFFAALRGVVDGELAAGRGSPVGERGTDRGTGEGSGE